MCVLAVVKQMLTRGSINNSGGVNSSGTGAEGCFVFWDLVGKSTMKPQILYSIFLSVKKVKSICAGN